MPSSRIYTKCFILFACLVEIAISKPVPGHSETETPRLVTRAGQPYYSPDDWPHTIHIATEDDQETSCYDFPDRALGGWAESNTVPTTYEIFCWQNGTIEKLGNIFLKTTKGCYLDENDIKEGNAPDVDFTKLLPWCGPLRPYEVYSTKSEYMLPGWDPVAGYLQNCWLDTTLNSITVHDLWFSVHTYCWVNGTTVGSSNRWYENAKLINGTKCYFPYDSFDVTILYTGPMASMAGGGNECPDWDHPPDSHAME